MTGPTLPPSPEQRIKELEEQLALSNLSETSCGQWALGCRHNLPAYAGKRGLREPCDRCVLTQDRWPSCA